MPAPNEFVWYKWFPVKAITSIRWQSLTLAQKGFYRELYDWAAIAQPSSRRGYLYEHDKPATLADIVHMTHSRNAHAVQKHLNVLADKGLMCQDENGAWGFTNFAKHQHGGPLRVRKDGLGTAEIRGRIGPESVGNRSESGQTDADVDADAVKRTSHGPDVPPALIRIAEITYGTVTAHHECIIQAWTQKHPAHWIREAMERTHRAGVDSLSYTAKILGRFEHDGEPDALKKQRELDGIGDYFKKKLQEQQEGRGEADAAG